MLPRISQEALAEMVGPTRMLGGRSRHGHHDRPVVIDAIRRDAQRWQFGDFRLSADLGAQHVERDQPAIMDGRKLIELLGPSLAWDFMDSHGAVCLHSGTEQS